MQTDVAYVQIAAATTKVYLREYAPAVVNNFSLLKDIYGLLEANLG